MTRPSPAGTCYPMSSSGHGAEHPFLTSLQPVHVHQLRSGKRNRSQERPCITHMGLLPGCKSRREGRGAKKSCFPFLWESHPPCRHLQRFQLPLCLSPCCRRLVPLCFCTTTAWARCDSRWAPGIAPSAKCIRHLQGVHARLGRPQT